MVRFSCFNAHIGNQKPKKTVQPSFEAMHTTLEGFSQVQAPKESIKATNMASVLPEVETTEEIHNSVKPVTDSSSLDHSWKSVETKDNNNLDSSSRVLQNSHCLQKSRSLGSRLCREGRVPGQNDTDDETDQGFSSDSHDHGLHEDGRKNTVESQNGPCSESVQVSSHHDLAFSVGDPQLSEKDGHDISNLPFHCGHANGSGNDTSSAHAIVKSSSMPNILASALIFEGHSPSKYLTHSTRSSEDVHVLSMRRKENLINDVDSEVMREQERDDGMHKNHKTNFESPYEGFESYSCSASAKDWIVPVSDEVNSVKILHEELRVLNQNDLTGNDFKIKRIEDWVNDLQHVRPLEDTFEISHPKDPVKVEPTASNGLTAAKVGVMETPCMDAAKRYMSSLSASATTAQLVNHGLVVIPFLSAFVSLKVLNLSGNAIAKISAGALPRGLHMLNLSRNNISTIEGLRELTRLRVLNLSYNRILRIGHGLASCSSLKELYLAGNKISEVEGLHRLLKLAVLDLRFNKISTAKCLGQLAANYNSVQAISLEGNPAQKNVGDENLKKHLQGLLPNLVYFNRQAIKVSAMKDGAERSVRLGISGHQFERGLRSEKRAPRKKNHGTSTRRPSSSSTHGHKSQAVASPMQSRGRHGRHPPPSGMKVATNHQNHYGDLGTKLLKFKPGLSMRRTQSEGTLEHL